MDEFWGIFIKLIANRVTVLEVSIWPITARACFLEELSAIACEQATLGVSFPVLLIFSCNAYKDSPNDNLHFRDTTT